MKNDCRKTYCLYNKKAIHFDCMHEFGNNDIMAFKTMHGQYHEKVLAILSGFYAG